jgi:hypothetical protein
LISVRTNDEPSVKASFSTKDALSFAKETLVRKFWLLLPVQYAIGAASAGIDSCIKAEPLHSIVASVVISLMMGGFWGILLDLCDGRKTGFFEIFSKLGLWWRFLLANYVAFVLWGLGLILLVVPGVIAIIHTCFFGLCIADEKLGPIASFKRSSQLTKGCRLKILGLLCLLGLIAVASMATGLAVGFCFKSLRIIALLICGAVVATGLIFTELVWAHCYRQLTRNHKLQAASYTAETSSKNYNLLDL